MVSRRTVAVDDFREDLVVAFRPSALAATLSSVVGISSSARASFAISERYSRIAENISLYERRPSVVDGQSTSQISLENAYAFDFAAMKKKSITYVSVSCDMKEEPHHILSFRNIHSVETGAPSIFSN